MSQCPYCATDLPDAFLPAEDVVLYACPGCFNACVLRREGGEIHTAVLEGAPDVRALATPGSIGGELLAIVAKSVDDLPVLPEVSHHIISMLHDPDASMEDLAELISHDPVVAAKILRVANSAMYGGLHEIVDLKSACARLGTRTVANVVQALSSGAFYTDEGAIFPDLMRRLWRHAVATAHCANEIAMQVAEPRPDTLFVGGLIHCIGQVVLLDAISRSENAMIIALKESQEVVGEILASYSPLVGLHVVQQWNLPPEFGVLVMCHHDPKLAPAESWESKVHILCLAESMATVSGYGITEENDITLLGHPSAQYFGLTDVKLASLRVDLEERVEPLLELIGSGAG
ncbi:MAG: HDOD domain-containing protein [Nitrospiraceae bacterium]|nr:HDOD domain-containing protein [Nitrospiraceae bacterium]